MSIDFGKLTGRALTATILSPREIFSILPRAEQKYQYLRDVQAEVLT